MLNKVLKWWLMNWTRNYLKRGVRSCTEKGSISLLMQMLKVCPETVLHYEGNVLIQNWETLVAWRTR